VDESLEAMIDQYHELNDAAEEVNYIDISNFAQDQIAALAKFRWMVEATVGEDD
jgi:DNA-binding ferritin-like protein